jgi:predicted RNA-binding protein YlxR (DUF448 family)
MGRSVYLCPRVDCLKGVERKGRLAKALKAPVPPDILKALWEQAQHHPCNDSSFFQETVQRSGADTNSIH